MREKALQEIGKSTSVMELFPCGGVRLSHPILGDETFIFDSELNVNLQRGYCVPPDQIDEKLFKLEEHPALTGRLLLSE